MNINICLNYFKLGEVESKQNRDIVICREWLFTLIVFLKRSPRCRTVGDRVFVKALCDLKVIGSKLVGTKNPSMLRVGMAQAGCDPWVILTAKMPLSRGFLATG